MYGKQFAIVGACVGLAGWSGGCSRAYEFSGNWTWDAGALEETCDDNSESLAESIAANFNSTAEISQQGEALSLSISSGFPVPVLGCSSYGTCDLRFTISDDGRSATADPGQSCVYETTCDDTSSTRYDIDSMSLTFAQEGTALNVHISTTAHLYSIPSGGEAELLRICSTTEQAILYWDD